MTLVPNSSFYVTLMSHASTKEFPGNKSHHFRNRLPKPIRFVGRGWMVGMVSLSLPTIPAIAEEGGVRKQLSSSTGSHFFHQLVYRYEQERAKQTAPLN